MLVAAVILRICGSKATRLRSVLVVAVFLRRVYGAWRTDTNKADKNIYAIDAKTVMPLMIDTYGTYATTCGNTY